MTYMAREPYANFWPKVADTAFVAESADLIGDVTIGEHASVWYHTTLRADINKIVIGDYSNIQDNSCIHLADDFGCYVGKYVTVGHGVILHACTVEDNCLIGMGSIILDGAVIGQGSVVGAGALITKGTVIPPNSLVLGSPAKVMKDLGPGYALACDMGGITPDAEHIPDTMKGLTRVRKEEGASNVLFALKEGKTAREIGELALDMIKKRNDIETETEYLFYYNHLWVNMLRNFFVFAAGRGCSVNGTYQLLLRFLVFAPNLLRANNTPSFSMYER